MIDQPLQVRELQIGCGAGEAHRGTAVLGQREHQGQEVAREHGPHAGRRGDHRRGDDLPGDGGRGAQVGDGHERRVVAHRERDRLAREPRERADDDRCGGLLVEDVAHRPRLDQTRRPWRASRASRWFDDHLSRHLAELILEGGVIDARCGTLVLPRGVARPDGDSRVGGRNLRPGARLRRRPRASRRSHRAREG